MCVIIARLCRAFKEDMVDLVNQAVDHVIADMRTY